MSEALRDAPDVPPVLRAVNVRDPIIELVTTTGSREPAVLIYRSTGVGEGLSAEPDGNATPHVYGLAMRIPPASTPSEEMGLDFPHEIWRTSTRVDADRSSAMAWIMAIAHRRAVDRLRSGRDTTSPPPDGPVLALGRRARRHASQAILDQASVCDDAAQVGEALARLNPEQREALELAYLDGDVPAPSADPISIPSPIVTTGSREV
jgi:RNA polymerase sigma-70 factor (ECF subfamily)